MSNRPTAVIADDSQTFLMYFSTLLNRMNFEVLPVRTGEEAYDLARVVNPGLIALDVMMPRQSGLETLKKIRGDSLLAKTPVVMISGSMQYAEDCFAIGCCDFLTKPIELRKLHDALQSCQPKQENKRRHLRAPFNRKLSFCVEGKRVNSFAVSLSEGGIYLRTVNPPPVGTRVEVDIPLGERESMVLCGDVIYTKELLKGRFSIPPGMAIRFDACKPEMRKRLHDEVVQLLVGDILDEQQEVFLQKN